MSNFDADRLKRLKNRLQKKSEIKEPILDKGIHPDHRDIAATKLKKKVEKLQDHVEELEDQLNTALEEIEHSHQMLHQEIVNIKRALGVE